MIGIGKWIFKLVENSVIPIISQEQEAHYWKIICAIYAMKQKGIRMRTRCAIIGLNHC